jgi:hypothetical protein
MLTGMILQMNPNERMSTNGEHLLILYESMMMEVEDTRFWLRTLPPLVYLIFQCYSEAERRAGFIYAYIAYRMLVVATSVELL